MKVGFVTDTHYGYRDDSSVIESLEAQAEGFAESGVEAVVHLGDVSNEMPEDEYIRRVESVVDVFSDFEFYMTPGNHDVSVVGVDGFAELFDMQLNTVVWEDSSTCILLVNTASLASFPGVSEPFPAGCVSDTAQDLIEQKLNEDKEVVVCTHYPIQYATEYTNYDFFEVRPEYTFPVNKLSLEKLLVGYDDFELSVFCGHLHPETTVQFTTEPFGIDISVVQSVQLYDKHGTEFNWFDNPSLSVAESVFEF